MSYLDSYISALEELDKNAAAAIQAQTADLDPAGIYEQSAALSQEMAYLEQVITKAAAAFDIVTTTHARGTLNQLKVKNAELSFQLVAISQRRAEITAAAIYQCRIEKLALLDRIRAAYEEQQRQYEEAHRLLWVSINRSQVQGAEAEKQAETQRQSGPAVQAMILDAKATAAAYLVAS